MTKKNRNIKYIVNQRIYTNDEIIHLCAKFDAVYDKCMKSLLDKQYDISIDDDMNNKLVKSFPNVLLMEEFSINTPLIKEEQNVNEGKKNLWELLDEINNESLDITNLQTDSESEISKKPKCNNCGSDALIEDHAASIVVCSECGVVSDTILSQGPEWRSYVGDDGKGDSGNRCGCPTNFFFPRSTEGTIIAGSSNTVLKKKQGWNSMIYKEKSLNEVFETINTVCAKNGILKIISDDAKIFYKNLSECKHTSGKNKGKQIITRSKNRTSIIAACVLKACEKNENPRRIDDIADFFGIPKKKVTIGCKQFNAMLKNSDIWRTVYRYNSVDITEHHIRQKCKRLNISNKDTQLAVTISRNCCKFKLVSDHNPMSVAAGAVLVMVKYKKLPIDKKDISRAFKTSDVTIGKIQNKLINFIRVIVSDEFTDVIIDEFNINRCKNQEIIEIDN